MSLNIMHSWLDIKIIDENIFFNKMCACKNKPMCENRVPKQQTAHSGAVPDVSMRCLSPHLGLLSYFNIIYLLSTYCVSDLVLADSLPSVSYIAQILNLPVL